MDRCGNETDRTLGLLRVRRDTFSSVISISRRAMSVSYAPLENIPQDKQRTGRMEIIP